MTKRRVAFDVGDAVTLKGQAAVLTVIPRPDGAIQKDDWVWTAYACANGVVFNLLPEAALVKKGVRS